MMKIMTSDDVLEQLQKLALQSNGSNNSINHEDKENLKEMVKINQLDTRLQEVTKENQNLIDELQDKKFEVYKLKNNYSLTCDTYDQVEVALEDKIASTLKKMGTNKKQIESIQSIIKETMEDFKNKIISESESDV